MSALNQIATKAGIKSLTQAGAPGADEPFAAVLALVARGRRKRRGAL